MGQRYGLELLSPVDDAGNFTEEAGDRFKGLNVQVRAAPHLIAWAFATATCPLTYPLSSLLCLLGAGRG